MHLEKWIEFLSSDCLQNKNESDIFPSGWAIVRSPGVRITLKANEVRTRFQQVVTGGFQDGKDGAWWEQEN